MDLRIMDPEAEYIVLRICLRPVASLQVDDTAMAYIDGKHIRPAINGLIQSDYR